MPVSFQRILLTGGTGSLGHALAAFLLAQTTATVLIYSRDEYKQLLMRQQFGEERIRYLLGDVRDLPRLMLACRGVDLVVHTAALKYVDVGEYNPSEFIATNIGGTDNVAKACIERGVQKAIFVSSDKAIQARNLYGSSKATAAALWTCANAYDPQGCVFTTVRYANVTGSRGSVVPLWRDQVARGRVPTLTSCRMSRFWLTLEEAVAAVWFTAQYGMRGHTVVPHLPAYQVVDLLRAVAGEGVEPAIVGERQGEKLAETVMSDDEMATASTYHAVEGTRYYSVPPTAPSWATSAMGPEAVLGYVVTPSVDAERPYRSDVWSWRLGVEELRERLDVLGV